MNKQKNTNFYAFRKNKCIPFCDSFILNLSTARFIPIFTSSLMQAASFCLGPLVGLKPQSGILGFPALEFLPPKSLALDGRDGLLLGIFFM